MNSGVDSELNIEQLLIQYGVSGAVLVTVLLFLKHLRERDSDHKETIEQFTKAIAASNEALIKHETLNAAAHEKICQGQERMCDVLGKVCVALDVHNGRK